jgi:hypothetical protein
MQHGRQPTKPDNCLWGERPGRFANGPVTGEVFVIRQRPSNNKTQRLLIE